MKVKALNIGEIDVSYDHVHYICYGLGSCIGLFVTDRVKRISAAAHISMPARQPDGSSNDAGSMIQAMLELLSTHGSDLCSLRAKVTGGAHVIVSSQNVGAENSSAVVGQLIEKRIFVAGLDVGGSISRTARFNSTTGELVINTSERKTYSI